MGGCLYRHWMLNPSIWVNGVDLAVDRTSQVTGHAQPSVITTRIRYRSLVLQSYGNNPYEMQSFHRGTVAL